MPVGNLPSEAKKLYESVYKQYRDKGMSEEEAAKRAWGAVKNAGYSKGEDGKWHKKADLSEFSLVMLSVGINKETGDRFWKASTSDIHPDTYNDEMSLALYDSFLNKIETGVLPPEQYRSEAWEGGMPYVSVAHYREHSIAGDTDNVYVDGDVLKARGTFRNTPLGLASFNALCDDLYGQKKAQDRIRVSIAFLDYKHQHKSNGFVFERSETNEVCPECLKEKKSGTRPGRIFLDGLLIHFAMTRVPVNKRTLMEVEKSMTTKKEDAASIVGKALAEEIEEKEGMISRSELVEKSDEEPVAEPTEEITKCDDGEMEYKPFGGSTTMSQVKEWAMANKEAERVRDVWYAFQVVMSNIMRNPEIEDKGKAIEDAASELRSMIKNKNEIIFESLTDEEDPGEEIETVEATQPSFADLMDRIGKMEENLATAITAMQTSLQQPATERSEHVMEQHPLDAAYAQLKSDYDTVVLMDGNSTEKLQAIQSSFGSFGQEIKVLLSETAKETTVTTQDSSIQELTSLVKSLADRVDLLTQQRSLTTSQEGRTIPAPRSINPASVPQIQERSAYQPNKSGLKSLREIVDTSVGLK